MDSPKMSPKLGEESSPLENPEAVTELENT